MKYTEVWQNFAYGQGPAAGILVPYMLEGIQSMGDDNYHVWSRTAEELLAQGRLVGGIGLYFPQEDGSTMVPVGDPWSVERVHLSREHYKALSDEEKSAYNERKSDAPGWVDYQKQREALDSAAVDVIAAGNKADNSAEFYKQVLAKYHENNGKQEVGTYG